MKYRELVKKTITKEKVLHETLSAVGLTFKETSPLDVSYLSECFALIGFPDEGKGIKSWDDFINDYVAAVYGDKEIDEVLNSYEEAMKTLKEKVYDPKKNKKLLRDFLNKEKALYSALSKLGISENSPLARLTYDWELADALFGEESKTETFHETLFKVIEKGQDVSLLLKN